MKYLLLFLILSSAEAKPRFNVGDCINPSRYEGIPTREGTCYHKVTAIGKRAYECKYVCHSEATYLIITFDEASDLVKVDCPKNGS